MQPEYYVNVRSGATVQGSGPITSISEWTVTRRIDAAGSWSFRMSAIDAQVAQVVLKRTVRIYAYINTAYLLVGGGIIDRIERQVDVDGVESLVIGGGDDLRELTYRTAGRLGLFTTTAFGLWTGTALGSATSVKALAVLGNGTLIAGCGGTGEVYTSTNGGATWINRGQLGAETTVYALAESNIAGTVIAGTGPNGKIFRSTNYGSTWAEIGQLGSETAIYDIALTNNEYGNNGLTAVGTSVAETGPIIGYISTDDGLNWITVTSSSGGVVSQDGLTVAYGGIVGTDNGNVYEYDPIGADFDFAAYPVGALFPINDIIYISAGVYWAASSNGGRIYVSSDTATWSQLAQISGRTAVTALLRISATLAYAAADGRVYRSVNDGVAWTEIYNVGSAISRLVALDDGTLLAACADGKVYVSGTLYSPISHYAAVVALDALKPSSWSSFVADATPGNDEIYLQFAGESLLAAVGMLADASQTHFYLSAAKTLTFIDTWTDSGVHAVQPVYGLPIDATTAAIAALTVSAQSYDVVTRCYPYGKVLRELAGIDLATSTPTGYTVDTGDNYVQHTAGHTAYGLIERMMVFDAVTADENSAALGNALVAAAVKFLSDTNAPVTNYSVTLLGCTQLLEPMETVRVTYAGDSVIDTDLYILESTWRGDESGIVTTGLVVGDAPVRLPSDTKVMADAIARVAKVAAR